MRVLGIDPGLVNMGWGVILVNGSRLTHVANGVCKSGKGDLAQRLLALHDQLVAVIAEFAPDACLLLTSPSPRDRTRARKPSVA